MAVTTTKTFAQLNQTDLTASGLSYGLLTLTGTGTGKHIFDAVIPFLPFLRSEGIHNYETQAWGGIDNASFVPAQFALPGSPAIPFEVSFYRAEGRGDRRLSFRGLDRQVIPAGLAAFVWLNGDLIVFNMSAQDSRAIIAGLLV